MPYAAGALRSPCVGSPRSPGTRDPCASGPRQAGTRTPEQLQDPPTIPDGTWNERYTAIIDSRTCGACIALDGMIFTHGAGPSLPLHPNCRCYYLPIRPRTPPTPPLDWATLPAKVLKFFVRLVARLLRKLLPVPALFVALIPAAEQYNTDHPPAEDEDNPDLEPPPPAPLARLYPPFPCSCVAQPPLEHTSHQETKPMPPNEPNPTTLTLSGRIDLAAGADRHRYTARFVTAGRIRGPAGRPGRFVIPAEAIQVAIAIGHFDNRPCFIDHASWFEGPSLRNMAGVSGETEWNPDTQSADGQITLYTTPAGDLIQELFSTVVKDQQDGRPTPDVGLSLVFWPRWKPRDNEGDPLVLQEFLHIESIDFVFEPAADGRITEALSTLAQGVVPMPPNSTETSTTTDPPPAAPEHPAVGDTPPEILAVPQPPVSPVAAAAPTVAPAPAATPDEWAREAQLTSTLAILQASGLPQATQDLIFAGTPRSPAELRVHIEQHQTHLAALAADQVIQIGDVPPRGRAITLGRTGLEQIEQAFEALMGGTRPPGDIQPLSGIRELYHLLSGDFEMAGLFRDDRVYLANVNSSTMAAMTADALNKRVVNLFQQYPRWWEPFVSIEDFASLQDVQWITLGGVGELPTVSEGAAYTELTWDDMVETDAFVKKGGYLGLTLEAIDKDDTRRLVAAPRALAQAAWLTLAKAISAIFTQESGTGPVMSDTNRLFDAGNHSNLLTTALSFTSYVAVRTAMRKQAELHSAERLGALTAPKYLLVPSDLEITALQVLASEGEPGTADNDANPLARGNEHDERLRSARSRVIVIDLWTDANNWAAVADPQLYPSIGLGFRYGRTPEIFSVASPTAGLMFTNDVMPVKVRFFFAVGPTDWRGLHKSNV